MSLSFLVYDIIIRVYAILIRIAAIFNPKAQQWIRGRKHWHRALDKSLAKRQVDIWIHCASLGEFEQGRPVLEALRKVYPEKYILLTFFSPSGYEIRKNYPVADHICYLPLDTARNAREFIALVNPRLAVFVKYEFWLHFLRALHQQKIPVLLISAIFRPDQLFFQWYGKAFRQLLLSYTRIFVQDKNSASLLQQAGTDQVTVTGDTRFDRVLQIARQAKEIEHMGTFLQGRQAWVCGSTWPEDERIIQSCHEAIPKWIIAPHEINEAHLLQIEQLFYGKTVRYSVLTNDPESYADKKVLLIDNIGMLSSLYRYGIVAYIGGGFDHGIHNILEAAVYRIPVVFGPKYHKFKEATDLITLEAAFSISNEYELKTTIDRLTDEKLRIAAGGLCGDYVKDKAGATESIIDYIQAKRFLIK
jgi:3-deoxy-D-manno-octulosonic-acid transferase